MRTAVLAGLACVILATTVAAADWQGQTVKKNETPHVMNPAHPIEKPQDGIAEAKISRPSSFREDRTLWVLNSQGAYSVDDGVIARFDVFDRAGRFIEEITIKR